ncbi:hypothetical protein Tco_1075513 [Tanacetum coccineum]
MVSTIKDPLTFNDPMATPIDFSKYVLNGLKIENVTQDILLGRAFNLLKGTFSSMRYLHLNNIEDMLLLAVQHKLFHLDVSVIVDFIVALRMITRSLILKRRVKDLQLGVETDELYKLSDATLKSVRDEIRDRVLDFRLDYNTEMPKRKWTAVDRKRSGLMFDLIDKQLREREIIRNLERLVGARELEMDYKLMTRTV